VHGVVSAVRWVAWQMIRLGARFVLAAETGETAAEAIFSQVFLAVAVK
jgi:hypothetical protein